MLDGACFAAQFESNQMDKPELNQRFPRSEKYPLEWIRQGGMGSHPLWMTEWLCEQFNLQPGMRVLDLGRGARQLAAHPRGGTRSARVPDPCRCAGPAICCRVFRCDRRAGLLLLLRHRRPVLELPRAV